MIASFLYLVICVVSPVNEETQKLMTLRRAFQVVEALQQDGMKIPAWTKDTIVSALVTRAEVITNGRVSSLEQIMEETSTPVPVDDSRKIFAMIFASIATLLAIVYILIRFRKILEFIIDNPRYLEFMLYSSSIALLFSPHYNIGGVCIVASMLVTLLFHHRIPLEYFSYALSVIFTFFAFYYKDSTLADIAYLAIVFSLAAILGFIPGFLTNFFIIRLMICFFPMAVLRVVQVWTHHYDLGLFSGATQIALPSFLVSWLFINNREYFHNQKISFFSSGLFMTTLGCIVVAGKLYEKPDFSQIGSIFLGVSLLQFYFNIFDRISPSLRVFFLALVTYLISVLYIVG